MSCKNIDLTNRAEEKATLSENLGMLPPAETRHMSHEVRIPTAQLEVPDEELYRMLEPLKSARICTC